MKVHKIETYASKHFSTNTYIIENNKKCIIIDPGDVNQELLDKTTNLEIDAIILTHGHFDHIFGIPKLKDVPVYISLDDKELLLDNEKSYASDYDKTFDLSKREILTFNSSELNLIGLNIKIIETPGHTKGSVCFKIENYLFTGDTLFYNSIGRTDLYSGSPKKMFTSLKLISSTISNNTMIHPGHESSGSFDEIKKVNTYIK